MFTWNWIVVDFITIKIKLAFTMSNFHGKWKPVRRRVDSRYSDGIFPNSRGLNLQNQEIISTRKLYFDLKLKSIGTWPKLALTASLQSKMKKFQLMNFNVLLFSELFHKMTGESFLASLASFQVVTTTK